MDSEIVKKRVETVKKQVWELAEEINELVGRVLEPMQQSGSNTNIGLKKIGEQGILYVKARTNGYQVSISEPIREKMYDFMVQLTGKEPDGYNQKEKTEEPRWDISDFQQARKAAYFLADTKPPCSLLELDDEFQAGVMGNQLAEEIDTPEDYMEGASKTVSVNTYERSADARAKCVAHYGYSCSVCGFDFEALYGEIGHKYIHVHHIVPLAEIRKEYVLDPVKDLIPVCANCHAIIHRTRPALRKV